MNIAQLVEFAGNHPLLVSAFLGVSGLLVITELRGRLSGIKQVGVVEATQLSNRDNALFLDIREEADYRAGHIPDAVHIPLKQLATKSSELEKFRNRPVIAYCRSGNQSRAAGSLLKKSGFESVYNLSGGMVAWQGANLPTSKA